MSAVCFVTPILRSFRSVCAVLTMSDGKGFVARVRGLPWSCSVDEVQRFFSGETRDRRVINRIGGLNVFPALMMMVS